MKLKDLLKNKGFIFAMVYLLFFVFIFVGICFEWDDKFIGQLFIIFFFGSVIISIVWPIKEVITSLFLDKKKSKNDDTTKVKLSRDVKNDINELKEYNIKYELKIDMVHGTKENLLLVAIAIIDSKNYSFISLYKGNGKKIADLINKNNITKINTWIDFTNPEIYEFDIEDMSNNLEISQSFVLCKSYVISDDKKASMMIDKLKNAMN